MTAFEPATALDRLLRAVREIVRVVTARTEYLGAFEYAVQLTDGTTVDATPIDTSRGLPSLVGVPITLGPVVAKPKVGSRCLVEFCDGDPTKPVVRCTDPIVQSAALDATGLVDISPSGTARLCSGTLYAARKTDATSDGSLVIASADLPVGSPTTRVYTYTYTAPGGSPQVWTVTYPIATAPLLAPNPTTVSLAGVISGGSSKVRCG